MVYSTRRFVLSLALCYFVLVCFSVLLALRLPRLGKREPILVLFVRLFDLRLFGFCLFSLPLGAWKGLRLVIVTLFGLFSYIFSNALLCQLISRKAVIETHTYYLLNLRGGLQKGFRRSHYGCQEIFKWCPETFLILLKPLYCWKIYSLSLTCTGIFDKSKAYYQVK